MEILGKSNQTLFGHTRDCLTVCDELLMRRKLFLQNFCERYGWGWKEVCSCIRFAVWFHDIGKASDKWQSYIRESEEDRWKHQTTHALPSFVIGAMVLGIQEFEKAHNLRRCLLFWPIMCKCSTTTLFLKIDIVGL